MSRERYRMWTTTPKNIILHTPSSPVLRSHSHSTPREAPLPLHNSRTWCRLRTRARPGAWISMRQSHVAPSYWPAAHRQGLLLKKYRAVATRLRKTRPHIGSGPNSPRARATPRSSSTCNWHDLIARPGAWSGVKIKLLFHCICISCQFTTKQKRKALDCSVMPFPANLDRIDGQADRIADTSQQREWAQPLVSL